MNAHAAIVDGVDTNMTSKGQVLIPKSLRDRAGLRPCEAVTVGLNDRGEVVVVPARKAPVETPEQRRERIRRAIDEIAGAYATGQSADEYVAEIRGPYPDPA